MSWGSLFGRAAEDLLGERGYRIAGDAFDLFSAGRKQDQLATEQDKFRQKELQLATLETNQFLSDRSNQLQLRDKLLKDAELMQKTTGEVNKMLGIPYTPTQAEIISETASLSETYQRDVMKLAELNASRKQAAHMSKMGGAESSTMLEGMARENVETYGEQLNKARQRAKTDALANATSRMDFDQKSRAATQGYFDEGMRQQFTDVKGLYNNKQILMPTSEREVWDDLSVTAGEGYQKATKDMADAVSVFGDRLTKSVDGQSALQRMFNIKNEPKYAVGDVLTKKQFGMG